MNYEKLIKEETDFFLLLWSTLSTKFNPYSETVEKSLSKN